MTKTAEVLCFTKCENAQEMHILKMGIFQAEWPLLSLHCCETFFWQASPLQDMQRQYPAASPDRAAATLTHILASGRLHCNTYDTRRNSQDTLAQ